MTPCRRCTRRRSSTPASADQDPRRFSALPFALDRGVQGTRVHLGLGKPEHHAAQITILLTPPEGCRVAHGRAGWRRTGCGTAGRRRAREAVSPHDLRPRPLHQSPGWAPTDERPPLRERLRRCRLGLIDGIKAASSRPWMSLRVDSCCLQAGSRTAATRLAQPLATARRASAPRRLRERTSPPGRRLSSRATPPVEGASLTLIGA